MRATVGRWLGRVIDADDRRVLATLAIYAMLAVTAAAVVGTAVGVFGRIVSELI